MHEGKVIITFALTGCIHSKEANPKFPEQLDEIVNQGIDAWRAGAAILLVHTRNPNGSETASNEVLRQLHERLCAETGAIVQLTTGGSLGLSMEERPSIILLDPEMCSLNMGLLPFSGGPGQAGVGSHRSEIERLVQEMHRRGIRPEMEASNLAMLVEVNHLIDTGLVLPPYIVHLTLHATISGGGADALQNLVEMMGFLPSGTIFNVSATGQAQLPISTMAMAMGLNVRISMEENGYSRQDKLVNDGAQIISRTVRIARELELEPATPEEAREFLKLRGREAGRLPESLITEQTHGR